MNVDDDETRAALERVRAFLVEQLGNPDFPLVPSDVPDEFHELIPLAEQFGIGDDPARDIAIKMMPSHFILGAADLIGKHRESLDRWLNAGEWNEERNSFCCLLQALDHATTAPVRSVAVSPEKVAELTELLRKSREK